MGDTYQGFDARLKNINKARSRLARGYSAKVTRDGLIVFVPQGRRSEFPLRGIVWLIVGFLVFKAIVMANIGATVYDARVDALWDGSLIEQAGAFIMQADLVSEAIAGKIRPVFW